MRIADTNAQSALRVADIADTDARVAVILAHVVVPVPVEAAQVGPPRYATALPRRRRLPFPSSQSAIEETLARIGTMPGVEGYVIVDNNGVLLRHSVSYTESQALEYAGDVSQLTAKARHVVRDLEPRNDLELFRLRGREREILVAPGAEFLVLIVQRWRVADCEA